MHVDTCTSRSVYYVLDQRSLYQMKITLSIPLGITFEVVEEKSFLWFFRKRPQYTSVPVELFLDDFSTSALPPIGSKLNLPFNTDEEMSTWEFQVEQYNTRLGEKTRSCIQTRERRFEKIAPNTPITGDQICILKPTDKSADVLRKKLMCTFPRLQRLLKEKNRWPIYTGDIKDLFSELIKIDNLVLPFRIWVRDESYSAIERLEEMLKE